MRSAVLRKGTKRACHRQWATAHKVPCAVTRNKSQVVLKLGRLWTLVLVPNTPGIWQLFLWVTQSVQHCCVGSWGINSHLLPEATEALRVVLDMETDGEDYTITLYVHLSLFLTLRRSFPFSLPSSKYRSYHPIDIVLMDDYFLEKPLCVM